MNKVIKPNSSYELCSVCQLGKAPSLPIFHVHTRSSNPFDIIHVDLWGTSTVESFHHMKYFLLFVDNCTQLQWIYVLNNKGQAASVFLHFEAMILTQFHANIKQLQSDGGAELKN